MEKSNLNKKMFWEENSCIYWHQFISEQKCSVWTISTSTHQYLSNKFMLDLPIKRPLYKDQMKRCNAFH